MKIFAFCLACTFCLFADAQAVEVVPFSEVEKLMNEESADLKVFNFWATWCAPCVKELPHFEKANQEENVQVYLVSLDFVQDWEKVERFIDKKKLKSRTLLLKDRGNDVFINKISKRWSGAIPATLFVDESGSRHFYEQTFSASELEQKIKYLLN